MTQIKPDPTTGFSGLVIAYVQNHTKPKAIIGMYENAVMKVRYMINCAS